MPLLLAGLSHRSAPLELREALALDRRLEESYGALKSAGLSELVLLSTCNRVEAYALAEDPAAALAALRAFFEKLAPGRGAQVRKALYSAEGEAMLWHLLQVASSLDSLVLGEAQILGQVKQAYEKAVQAGAVGPVFHGLFQRVFAAAKQVRSETEIGRHPASVPSVAVQLAQRLFGRLEERCALVLGAGEMAELAAEHLQSAGAAAVSFCNRSLPKARALARRFKGQALGLESLGPALEGADVVVCSTGAPQPLVLARAVEAGLERRQQPQLFLDLSVPRNIEPAVGELEGAYLYNLDDLEILAAEHREKRLEASRQAEVLLKHRLRELQDWLAASRVQPTLLALSRRFEEVRQAELKKALGKLQHLEAADREKVEALSRAIVQKLLHQPLSRLKRQAAKGGGGETLVRGAEQLFGLGEEEE